MTRVLYSLLSGREIHFPTGNTNVAICWNIRNDTCARTGDAPYIDFIHAPEEDLVGSDFYEDEDSPADGGMDIVFASTLCDELTRAINYIRLHPHA